MIENKINAEAMPEQPERYELRGRKAIKAGLYDEYYVFLTAPSLYFDNNVKAKCYKYRVAYEEIACYFKKNSDNRSNFKLMQIQKAIDKQKEGYQLQINPFVTNFWNSYVSFKNFNYPNLRLVVGKNVKPTKGVWTYFKTNIDKVNIYYKSNKGYVDLTFGGQAAKIDQMKSFLAQILGDYYKMGLSVVKTGKSIALRIYVPKVDFEKSFKEQEKEIEESFIAVNKLYEISNVLDIAGINKILSKN